MEWSAWSGADTVPRGTRIVLRVVLLLLDTPCWPFVCLFVCLFFALSLCLPFMPTPTLPPLFLLHMPLCCCT